MQRGPGCSGHSEEYILKLNQDPGLEQAQLLLLRSLLPGEEAGCQVSQCYRWQCLCGGRGVKAAGL